HGKCPKVLVPRSGRLGDTKHLVLPGEIVQALPPAIRQGLEPIRVRVVLLPSRRPQQRAAKGPYQRRRMGASSSSMSDTDGNTSADNQQAGEWDATAQPQEAAAMCLIGNGPGGFPAVQIVVSELTYGRRTEFFRLLPDLTLELGVGARVVRTAPRRAVEGKPITLPPGTGTGTLTTKNSVSSSRPAGMGAGDVDEVIKRVTEAADQPMKTAELHTKATT
ncbi:hypothetical protein VaNZ11_011848, partial [Volvox africanus]